jgi:hypothetical protein
MRVNSVRGRQHRTFRRASDGAQSLSQRLVGRLMKGDPGHHFKMGPQRSGRTFHQRQRKIGVGTRTAFIHQSGLGRKFRFLDEGSDGKSREVRSPALRLSFLRDRISGDRGIHYSSRLDDL